jgi:predicted metal-dependent peptidase
LTERGIEGLTAARLWAATRFPYLASGVFGAAIMPAPGSGTVSVDESWRMRADPELTADWTPAQLGSVLIHHVCHLLRSHGERAQAVTTGPAETRAWVRAADAEINVREASDRRSGSWLDCGSGADGMPRPDEGPGGLPGWQADLLKRQVAQDVMSYARQAGTVPAGWLRWAEQTLHAKVDWRRVLAAELRRAVAQVAGAVDYSYRRPPRRSAVTGDVVLPALRRPVPEVAVVCDTSGSMSDELLAMVLAEVEGLLRALGLARQVRVLACDTAVASAQRVTSTKQVQLIGGGGTDMGAGIAAAVVLRPRPAVTVVLTDGYTPWPAQAPKGTRVVVGLLGAQAPDAPKWARAVRMDPELPGDGVR